MMSHNSVFSLALFAISVFIGLLSTPLQTRIIEITRLIIVSVKKIVRCFRYLPISKILYRGLFFGDSWEIAKTRNPTDNQLINPSIGTRLICLRVTEVRGACVTSASHVSCPFRNIDLS